MLSKTNNKYTAERIMYLVDTAITAEATATSAKIKKIRFATIFFF